MESDQQLIAAINKGDAAAFETLYYRYRDWVYRLAQRLTGNHHDAADVLQETFIYLLKKFPDLKLSCSMTTLLYPVVRHLSFNIATKDKQRLAMDDGRWKMEEAACVPRPSSLIPQDSSLGDLQAVLANLPIEQREVLLMRFVDDMTIPEIAEAINEPVSTVKSRLYRALEFVRTDARTRNYFLE
jgi:RNA polymerase sigma-70 factor, ECF subfamily